MKTHTTNYENAFIAIADDCPVASGQIPPVKGDKKSVANYQFEMLIDSPYQYTSDEVLFTVFALRKAIDKKDWAAARQQFFSKGQPCFRASPLTKRYGWGVHSDAHGRIAIYGAETPEYQQFMADESIKQIKAMKSRR